MRENKGQRKPVFSHILRSGIPKARLSFSPILFGKNISNLESKKMLHFICILLHFIYFQELCQHKVGGSLHWN